MLFSGPKRSEYIGVKGREEELKLPRVGGRSWQRMNASVVPHIDPEVVGNSRAIPGWKADARELTRVVQFYAPEVAVVDVR
ncbi:MAG: hypothetical protein ACRDQB_10540 [Thermocrispum sp.]